MQADIRGELIKAVIHVARTFGYFGHVMQQFEKVYVSGDHRVQTSAVGRLPGEKFIKFWMNTDYWGRVLQDYVRDEGWNYFVGGVLHETLHVVSGHLSIAFPDRVRGNVAVDLAVNSHLKDGQIAPGWCTPKQYGLESGRAAVWYYSQLAGNKTFLQQLKSGAFGVGGILEGIGTSHKTWEDVAADPVAHEVIKDVLRKAKELSGGEYGDIPGEIVSEIEAMLARKKAIVPWNQVLRMFCASAVESVLAYTMARRSRRFGTRPGTRKGDVLDLAVAVDTSGSISDELLATFFNEIRWILRNGAMVTVYEADCRVCRTYKFTGKFSGTVHGRGGTDLEPVLKAVEGKHDALVYFTDFYAPAIEAKYRIPTLWVLSTEMAPDRYPVKWGRHIKIEKMAA